MSNSVTDNCGWSSETIAILNEISSNNKSSSYNNSGCYNNSGYYNPFQSSYPSTGQPFYGGNPFTGYPLQLADQHNWFNTPVRAPKVMYYAIHDNKKSFEERKLSKRDGSYYIRERDGREIRIGKIKIKNKLIVNHHPDNSFDAMYIECELEGATEAKGIVIPYRDFIKRNILLYLYCFHRNVDCPDKYIITAFYQELLEGDDTKFLDLPQRSGWQCVEDKAVFVSESSAIPQLTPYYAPDILQRKLIWTDKKICDAADDLAAVMPKNLNYWILAIIRITSDLLFFYQREGLTSEQIFIIESDNEGIAQTAIALLKNRSFEGTAIPPLLQSKTALHDELNGINDGMALFRASSLIEDRRELERCSDVLLSDLTQCSGNEIPSRHLIALFAEHPGTLPPELPAFHINLCGCPKAEDLPALQQALGAFECLLIHLLNSSNPEENLVTTMLDKTKELPQTMRNAECYQLQQMLLATAHLLEIFRAISPEDLSKIKRYLQHQHHVESDTDQAIVNDFRTHLSACISEDILHITSQTGQPYFTNPSHMAVVDDRFINLTQEALDFYIIPHLTTTRRRNKLLHALDACGKLYHNNNFKRNIDIEVAAGIKETFGVYSVPKTLLTSPALAKVNAIAFEDHLFRQEAFPAEFLPIIRFSDTQIAGRVVNANTDEAESLYASGQTRSGKSFFLVQQALLRSFVHGDPVVIFDQTGAFTPEELRKHLPADVVERYFKHYDLCKQGLPVDLLSLEGCDTLPEKKNQLFSLFSVAANVTGDVQGKILRKCLTQIAKAIDNGLIESLVDTLVFFQEEDPDQMMLRARLEEVFNDLEDLPMSKGNWDGFLLCSSEIVVIDTSADGIRKSSTLIDMLLSSLYTWKQRRRRCSCTIVLDEIEDLILEKDGPISTILRKGGKCGLSMLLASQEFSVEKDKLGKIIGNCGMLAVFRPKDADISAIAKHLGIEQSVLAKLEQGECVASGGFYSKQHSRNRKTVIVGKAYPAAEYLKYRKHRYPFKRI